MSPPAQNAFSPLPLITMTFVRGSASIEGNAAEMPLMIFLFNSVKWLKAATYKGAAQLKKLTG
jgi:hypothetical protein